MIPNAPMRSGPQINVVPMEAPSGSKEAIDPSGSILPNFSAGIVDPLKARFLELLDNVRSSTQEHLQNDWW